MTPPWEGRSKHFTQDFETFALTLMREMPVERAGQILGENDPQMWRKNMSNWTEKEVEKWASMALERCVTGMAYEMRLVLQGIYEWKDSEEAGKMFGNWCAWVRTMREQIGELLEPTARAARMIEGHLEGIMSHWTQGLTTAFMEGLNSLFSAVKPRARGYWSVEYMTAMHYIVAGRLSLPCY